MIHVHLLNLLGEMQAGIEALREDNKRLKTENEMQRADLERLQGEATIAAARDALDDDPQITDTERSPL